MGDPGGVEEEKKILEQRSLRPWLRIDTAGDDGLAPSIEMRTINWTPARRAASIALRVIWTSSGSGLREEQQPVRAVQGARQ